MTEENRHATADAATRAQLIYAFRRIFSPLARILQRAGVPYYEFRDILKVAYIDAAIRDGMPGYPDKPSVEALACLLGVPYADISNLLSNPDLLRPPRETNTALIAAVLTKWSTDSNFQGPYGLPQQLAFNTPSGRSFTDLVKGIRPDADVEQLWDEMISTGAVELLGSLYVKMSGRQLVFGTDMKANLYEALGRAMEDLAATMNHNLNSSSQVKRFQRSVFGDRPLPVTKLDDFSELVRSVMREALVEIDDWLTQNTPEQSGEDTIDVGVTVFEYHREPSSEVSLKELVTAAPPTHVPAWVQVSALSPASIK
jgi:hypothetical protein